MAAKKKTIKRFSGRITDPKTTAKRVPRKTKKKLTGSTGSGLLGKATRAKKARKKKLKTM